MRSSRFTPGSASTKSAPKAVAGVWKPGYQTPATAFGADFVLALPGVKREDLL